MVHQKVQFINAQHASWLQSRDGKRLNKPKQKAKDFSLIEKEI